MQDGPMHPKNGRWLAMVLFLCVASLLAVPVQADLLSLPDPAGDVDGTNQGQGAPPFVDLVALDVDVGSDALGVTMHFDDDAGSAVTFAGSRVEYHLDFQVNDAAYRLRLLLEGGELPEPGDPGQTTNLSVWELTVIDPSVMRIAEGDAQVLDAGIQAVLGWDAFSAGPETPGAGSTISITGAGSAWYDDVGQTPTVHYYDVIDVPDGTFAVVQGSAAPGVSISSPRQIVFSNGEAATFAWDIHLTADGTQIAQVSYEADDDIEVTAPSELHLQEDTQTTFTVYATVPFAHAHGSARDITVHVGTTSGQSSIALGVRYLSVPQPAGHHDTLHLHAVQHGTTADTIEYWMNTIEERPPGAAGRHPSAYGSCQDASATRFGYAWKYSLSPALLIGLDGRPDADYSFSGRLVANQVTTNADLFARIRLADLDWGTPFTAQALVVDTSTIHIELPQMMPGDTIALEGAATMPPELDDVPPGGEENLLLEIVICPDAGANLNPLVTAQQFASAVQAPFDLEQGGLLSLPLSEYQSTFKAQTQASGFGFRDVAGTRTVSPGSDLRWELLLDATAEIEVSVSLLGSSKHVARIDGLSTRVLAAGVNPVDVVASIPQDAPDGSTWEFIVHVSSTRDAANDAAIRLLATVDADALASADDIVPEDGRATPFPFGLVAIAAALLLARSRM